ncbi:unnamed protein product [Absidia cylindrospora]
MYWKEECFGLTGKNGMGVFFNIRTYFSQINGTHDFLLSLIQNITAVTLMDKAVELNSIGGEYGNQVPTHFLCLTLKMLQLQPEREILTDLIKQEEFKYLRALAAFYLRIVGQSKEIYQYLEPLLNDYRKLRVRVGSGYTLSHMDEFIDQLLRQDRVCDVILPRLVQRHVLEDNDELEPRVSALEDDLESEQEDDDSGKQQQQQQQQRQRSPSASPSPERHASRRSRYHSDSDSDSDHDRRDSSSTRRRPHDDRDARDDRHTSSSSRHRHHDDDDNHRRRHDDRASRHHHHDESSSSSSRHRSRYRSPSRSRSRSSEDRHRHRR